MSVPEQIKVVYEGYVVGSAGGLEPGVETEETAKTLRSATESGSWTADKNTQAAAA